MKRVLSNKWSIAVFVLPTVLFFTYIVIVPIFKSFYYSMLNEIAAKVGDQSVFVGLENYIKMFTPGRRNDFPGAVLNSLTYAALSIFIQLPFSLLRTCPRMATSLALACPPGSMTSLALRV